MNQIISKKVFCSTNDSMSKINRETTAWSYVFAMVITERTNVYNIRTNKEMAKAPKEMNAQHTAMETQKVDNIIHSENIYYVPTRRQTLF